MIRLRSRPDQIVVDRFAVANASFWLDQITFWLATDGHADRLAADLWPGASPTGPPLQVIVGRAAAALRAALNDNAPPSTFLDSGDGR